VVLATSPQFFCAVGGWAVAKLRRRPFVFEVRDLWPESIKAVGAMRQSLLIEALEKLELFLYDQANGVVVATEAFRENLRSRGIDPRKITVVRNGVDLTRYAPRERDTALARELGLEGKFVVGYLGTHGMAHALHRVVEAAELVRDDRRWCRA
jgi:glycosyltransferase involved in cell wall biosynthesis